VCVAVWELLRLISYKVHANKGSSRSRSQRTEVNRFEYLCSTTRGCENLGNMTRGVNIFDTGEFLRNLTRGCGCGLFCNTTCRCKNM
jgi:hypothetical protein